MPNRIRQWVLQIHPLCKVIALFCMCGLFILSKSVKLQSFLLLQGLGLLFLYYLPSPKRFFKGCASIAIANSIYGFSYLLSLSQKQFSTSPVLFQTGLFCITQHSLLVTLTLVGRLSNLMIYSWMFGNIISRYELNFVLITYAKIPYRFAYGIYVALSFVSILKEDLKNIQLAHALKEGSKLRFLLHPYQTLQQIAFPLLLGCLVKAERTVLSMESRAFGILPARTMLRAPTFLFQDALALLVFLLVQAVIVTASLI